MSDAIKELCQSYDANAVQQILGHCNVLLEHFQLNYIELKLNIESPAKLFYDDFKLMLAECKAIVETSETVESERIVKRLRILRSVLKKFENTLSSKNNDEDDAMSTVKERSFAFGNVTNMSQREMGRPWGEHKISDSMAVVIDLDEFVRSFDAKAPQRNSVFYQSKRRRNRPQLPKCNNTMSPNLKKDINTPKRSSKRE